MTIIKKLKSNLSNNFTQFRNFLNRNKERVFLFIAVLFIFFYYFLSFNNSNKKNIVQFLAKPAMHEVFKRYEIGLYSNCSFLIRTRLENKITNYNTLINVIRKKAVKITKINDKNYDISYDGITSIKGENDLELINKLIEFDENYHEKNYKYEPSRCAKVTMNEGKTKIYMFRRPVILIDILINKQIKTDEDILEYFHAWIEFEALVRYWNKRYGNY